MSNNVRNKLKSPDIYKEYGVVPPDDDQLAIISDFYSKIFGGDGIICDVNTCAGSGKTTLIKQLACVLFEKVKYLPKDFLILTLNRVNVDVLNYELNKIWAIKRQKDSARANKKSKDEYHTFAYTFHSYVASKLSDDVSRMRTLLVDDTYDYSKNLFHKIQSEVIDRRYLKDSEFRKNFNALDELYEPLSGARGFGNRSLVKALKALGIKKFYGTSICDLKFRLSSNFLKSHTLRGESINQLTGGFAKWKESRGDANESKSIFWNFWETICHTLNSLTLLQIGYDFKVGENRLTLTIKKPHYTEERKEMQLFRGIRIKDLSQKVILRGTQNVVIEIVENRKSPTFYENSLVVYYGENQNRQWQYIPNPSENILQFLKKAKFRNVSFSCAIKTFRQLEETSNGKIFVNDKFKTLDGTSRKSLMPSLANWEKRGNDEDSHNKFWNAIKNVLNTLFLLGIDYKFKRRVNSLFVNIVSPKTLEKFTIEIVPYKNDENWVNVLQVPYMDYKERYWSQIPKPQQNLRLS